MLILATFTPAQLDAAKAKANDSIRKALAVAGLKHSTAAREVGEDPAQFSREINGSGATFLARLYLLGPTFLSQLYIALDAPTSPVEQRVADLEQRVSVLEHKERSCA
jgi:hypothetical protein